MCEHEQLDDRADARVAFDRVLFKVCAPLLCVLLVHGQVTIIFVVSVGLFVCLFVCAEFFSAALDPISIKLGTYVICLGLVVSPRI